MGDLAVGRRVGTVHGPGTVEGVEPDAVLVALDDGVPAWFVPNLVHPIEETVWHRRDDDQPVYRP
jgi:hypothetical protein